MPDPSLKLATDLASVAKFSDVFGNPSLISDGLATDLPSVANFSDGILPSVANFSDGSKSVANFSDGSQIRR